MQLKEDSIGEVNPLKSRTAQDSSRYKSATNETRVDKMLQIEKYALFSVLVFSITVFGLSMSVFGLSLIEFSHNINVSITKLSYGLSLSSICSCLGSLSASFFLDKWNRQLQFAFYWLVLGLVTIIFPFCTNFHLYLFISALQGFLVPYLNTIPSVWVVELFGRTSKTFLQLMHTFFPIGVMTGSIMTAPFLRNGTGETNSTDSPDVEWTPDEAASFFESLFITSKYSRLWIVYSLLSAFKLFTAVVIFIAYCVKPYKKPEMEKTKSVGDRDIFKEGKKNMTRSYLIVFVSLICLITGIQLANEFNANTFLPSYLIRNNRFSQEKAAYCQAMLAFSTLTGRVVNIFLTMKIGIQTFLFINFLSMLLGNALIWMLGPYSLYCIYGGIALLGFGFSNAFPMMISLVEERVTLSNRIMALLNFSGSVFLAISPVTVGRFLDSTPSNFILLNLALISMSLLIYIALITLDFLRLTKRLN